MDEHLRLSDVDRDRAAAALGEHYAHGRLTTDEHADRLDRVWAARTRGELGPLFGDLPGDLPGGRPGEERAASDPVRRRPRGPRLLLPVLALLGVLVVVTHAPWLLLLPVLAFVAVRRARWRRWAH